MKNKIKRTVIASLIVLGASMGGAVKAADLSEIQSALANFEASTVMTPEQYEVYRQMLLLAGQLLSPIPALNPLLTPALIPVNPPIPIDPIDKAFWENEINEERERVQKNPFSAS